MPTTYSKAKSAAEWSSTSTHDLCTPRGNVLSATQAVNPRRRARPATYDTVPLVLGEQVEVGATAGGQYADLDHATGDECAGRPEGECWSKGDTRWLGSAAGDLAGTASETEAPAADAEIRITSA